ncbi:hypothetical protein D3C72_1637950 [compost metagenome]
MFGNVYRKRGLAHGGARRQHHQVARLQAAGHAVQIDKAGGNASHIDRVVRHLLHAVEQVDHQGVQRLEALLHARAFLANGKNLLLGLVQHAVHSLALRIEGVGGDLVAGRHQLAQNGALPHDFAIAADIGGAGHILCQLVQIGQPPHFFGLANAL